VAGLLGEVRAADENLQTAALAAVVERAVGIDDHVPDLASRAVSAAVQTAVNDDAAADPGRPRDIDNVASPVAGAAVELAQARHVGVVRKMHLGAGGAAQHRYQRQ